MIKKRFKPLFPCTQLLGFVVILRSVGAVGNAEDDNHEQNRKGDNPLVELPLQRGKSSHKEEERQERLVIRQVCSEGESRPPRSESRMLYERTKDETTDKPGGHGILQTSAE